jgi:hypothetical protein
VAHDLPDDLRRKTNVSEHSVKVLGALVPCMPSEPGTAQMIDMLVLAKNALLASRPVSPHHDDLALHVRVIDEIEHTLCDPGYRTGGDFFTRQREDLRSALQLEYQRDLEGEYAKGFDGWSGHLDVKQG